MQQPELTDMQRAQAALVKVLPSPPPRSYILPAPSAASSAPSVVKIVMPPAAGSSSSQIRRLSISPTVQLSELMSTVITLCRLSEPFTLRYAPTAETATAIKTDEQLQAVFRQHQQQHSSTVIKLHVVHKSRRPLAPPAPRQPEPAPPSSSPTVSFPTAPPAPQPATAEPVSAACIQVPQFLQQDVQSLLRQGVLEPHDTLTLQQQRMLDDIAGFKQAWDRSLDPVLRQGRELVLSSQQPGTAVVYTYGAQREFHVVPPSFGRSLPGLPVAVSGVDAVTLLPPAAAPATAPPALQPSARFNVEVKQPKPRRERKDAPEAERSAASLQQLLSQQQELRSAVSSLRETTLAEAATMRGMLHGLFSKLESLELFIRDNESKREERREQRARDREAEKNSRDAEQQQRISQAGDDSAAASPAPYNTDDGDEQEGAEAARLLTPELDSASQQAGDGEEDEAAVEPFAGSASVPSATQRRLLLSVCSVHAAVGLSLRLLCQRRASVLLVRLVRLFLAVSYCSCDAAGCSGGQPLSSARLCCAAVAVVVVLLPAAVVSSLLVLPSLRLCCLLVVIRRAEQPLRGFAEPAGGDGLRGAAAEPADRGRARRGEGGAGGRAQGHQAVLRAVRETHRGCVRLAAHHACVAATIHCKRNKLSWPRRCECPGKTGNRRPCASLAVAPQSPHLMLSVPPSPKKLQGRRGEDEVVTLEMKERLQTDRKRHSVESVVSQIPGATVSRLATANNLLALEPFIVSMPLPELQPTLEAFVAQLASSCRREK